VAVRAAAGEAAGPALVRGAVGGEGAALGDQAQALGAQPRETGRRPGAVGAAQGFARLGDRQVADRGVLDAVITMRDESTIQ
jgi:hypothetical protein